MGPRAEKEEEGRPAQQLGWAPRERCPTAERSCCQELGLAPSIVCQSAVVAVVTEMMVQVGISAQGLVDVKDHVGLDLGYQTGLNLAYDSQVGQLECEGLGGDCLPGRLAAIALESSQATTAHAATVAAAFAVEPLDHLEEQAD